MNKTVKHTWTEALRSGKYLQGTDSLLRTDKDTHDERFCCLGVLCNIISPLGWDEPHGVKDGDGNYPARWFTYHGVTSAENLPTSLRGELDISGEAQTLLISMNDGAATFPDIADWIDENL